MGYVAHPFAARAAETEDARATSDLMTLPRGRRLRGHEHHAVVGFGLVRQCDRYHAGDARLLSLAVGADRHSGRRLCGSPVLSQRAAALRRFSVNMDVPISLGVVLAVGMSLVETINHAEHAYFDSAVMLVVLPAVRALPGSRDAGSHARGGGKSGRAARRYRTADRTRRRTRRGAGSGAASRRSDRGPARRSSAGRRCRDRGRLRHRRKPGDRRDALRAVAVGASAYAGSLNHYGCPDLAGHGGRRAHTAR